MSGELLEFFRDPMGLLSAAAFVGVGLVVFLFVQFLRWILRDHLAGGELEAGGQPVSNALAGGLAAQVPQSHAARNRLDQDLRHAGMYQPTARRDYLAARNALLLLIVITTGVLAVAIGPEQERLVIRVVVVGLTLAGLCWAIPRIVLRRKGNQRVERIRRAMPSALDMITMCMTGGLSFDRSLAHVSREISPSHPDLATELKIMHKQAEMTSTSMALDQFARRIDTDETRTVAALVGQGQRLGTGLAPSLQEYADSTRLKWRQSADERAGKAAVRMLLPVALCLLPSIFLLMWGPSILELWTFLQQFEGAGNINITSASDVLSGVARP